MKLKKLGGLTAVLGAALMGLVGCAHVESSTVSTDGSTSMEKVIGTLGESYESSNDGVKVTYNPTGSSSGIKAVAAGRADIGLSSRELNDEEKAQGLEATVLAYDGIAVVVNPKNSVSDLDAETVAKIYRGEVTDWSQIGGGSGEIVVIGREASSGTRDAFESITDIKDKAKYRQELTSTGDVITTVAQNPNAIGYASVSSLKSDVKALKIKGVEPTEANITNGSYVIQRPFNLVTKKDIRLTDTAQDFFDYITSPDAAKLIADAGVVPAVK